MGERDPREPSVGTHVSDEDGPTSLARVTAAWHETTDALRDSERRYRELVEYSLGLICTHDLAGTILSINPAAATSLGYRPEDGIGRNLREFLSADTRHLFAAYLQRIQTQGQDAGLMRVVARSGDEKVWMYRNVLSHGPGGSYVLGHAIDVTDRIAAERTLRRSEQALRTAHAELDARIKERTIALEEANERLRLESAEREEAERARQRTLIRQRDTLAFLSHFSEGLAPLVTLEDLVEVIARLPVPFLADWTMVQIIGEDESIRFVAGTHADPALTSRVATIAPPGERIDPSSHLRDVVSSQRLVVLALGSEETRSRLFGSGIGASTLEQLGARTVAMLPLVINGATRVVLSLFSATPDRFMSSDALVVEDVARRIRLALDRIQLYQEVEEANRLKDEFLGMLSHELRTPLNAIFGWARILRTRPLDSSTAHAVEVIERNAEAQLRLINEILDVSRIIKGKMSVAMEPLDIGAILRATIETLRPAIHAKRIECLERIGDTPPVLGDSHRLQQVFWNLLSNAVKFTGNEGTITIVLRDVEDSVELSISDTGVGIRRDLLPFVFDRFRQADSSTTRNHGGLGLGLAIVRHIVELHGGTVVATSAGEGHGATFTVRLPSAERGHVSSPGRIEAARSGRLTSGMLQGRTVLVVEDHDDARELIGAVLEGAGARVLPAASTREAMDLVSDEQPDLLIADLGLPGEDGYALLARVRERYPGVPALALTAYARATDRERALAAGFQQHVIKPVDPQKLLEFIGALLVANGRRSLDRPPK